MNQATQGNTALRRGSLALLLASLLVSVTTTKADVWTFNLIGAPSALYSESECDPQESIQMTGSGQFDPDQGTFRASGAATVYNACDHPAPPHGETLKGTWTATAFLSFTPDAGGKPGQSGGILMLVVHFDLATGKEQPNGILIVMEDGINVIRFGPGDNGPETYDISTGGSALFHPHGKAEP
jgi:hypothetical protein